MMRHCPNIDRRAFVGPVEPTHPVSEWLDTRKGQSGRQRRSSTNTEASRSSDDPSEGDGSTMPNCPNIDRRAFVGPSEPLKWILRCWDTMKTMSGALKRSWRNLGLFMTGGEKVANYHRLAMRSAELYESVVGDIPLLLVKNEKRFLWAHMAAIKKARERFGLSETEVELFPAWFYSRAVSQDWCPWNPWATLNEQLVERFRRWIAEGHQDARRESPQDRELLMRLASRGGVRR